jgi:lipopolysaccharide transport system ATP-binding protein
MQPIIKIENLSKQYRLGTIGTGTFSNDLKRWYYKVRGKEDPFLKIGETNNLTTIGNAEYVWKATKPYLHKIKYGQQKHIDILN